MDHFQAQHLIYHNSFPRRGGAEDLTEQPLPKCTAAEGKKRVDLPSGSHYEISYCFGECNDVAKRHPTIPILSMKMGGSCA
ncbi:MAG: hypothetical protein COB88_05950 [Flavobacteriales bacterium]|nr:MAG: hypothetical protein COB88_05950 [Flavobacteriales bacterium]